MPDLSHLAPPMDFTDFCCADESVGGCAHHLEEHREGRCHAAGCECRQYRKHPASCIHR